MKTCWRIVVAGCALSLFAAPAGAATMAGHGSFSGIVSRVSSRSITVNDATSRRAMSFLIVPTDGYGVLSPGGETTYQMSAIRIGWHIKVDYHGTGSSQRHADHIFLLR